MADDARKRKDEKNRRRADGLSMKVKRDLSMELELHLAKRYMDTIFIAIIKFLFWLMMAKIGKPCKNHNLINSQRLSPHQLQMLEGRHDYFEEDLFKYKLSVCWLLG